VRTRFELILNDAYGDDERAVACLRRAEAMVRQFQQVLTALKNVIRDGGLRAVGEPVFARYDPPFMPWFLHRSRIQINLARAATC
jgi:hypothetical protein